MQQGMNFRVEFARKEAMSAGEAIANGEQVFGSDGGVNDLGDRINDHDEHVNDRINEVYGNEETAGQVAVEDLHVQEAASSGKVSDRLNEHVNEHVNEQEYNVIREIQIDPEITYKRLAATLGISISTVRRRVLILKDRGIIRRVGSDKTGHWQILKPIDGDSLDNG